MPQYVLNFTQAAATFCRICTPDLCLVCSCPSLEVLEARKERRTALQSVQLKAAIFNSAPVDTMRTVSSSNSHAHWLFAGAELACVVLEIYKEAGAMACHSLASCLHSAYSRCATIFAEASPVLMFLWKELCGDCQHAMQAATGDYSIVVMGCEMVVMILVASVACKAPLLQCWC